MPQKKIIIVVLLSFFTGMKAYGGLADSLKLRLEQEQNDSVKIYLLNELSYSYLGHDNNLALFYAEKAVVLSNKIGSKFGLMRSWGQTGNAFKNLKNLNQAIACYIKGEKYAIELNDNLRKSALAHNIGIIYHDIGQYDKAEKYFLKSIEADKLNKDELSLAFSYNSLGATTIQLGKYKDARNYLNESLNLLIKTGNVFLSGMVYKNLGVLSTYQNDFNGAEIHFLKAIEYSKKSNSFDRLSSTYLQLTNVYLNQKKIDKALKTYEKALEFISYFEDKQFELGDIHKKVSDLYLERGEAFKAHKALTIAYEHYKTKSSNLDSTKAGATEKAFAEMATKYETEKNERELRIKKLELEQKNASVQRLNTYIFSGAIGILLLAGVLFFAIRNNRITKTANKKIQLQKEKIEIQRDEISLKNREITASIEYAKSLQDAILPDMSYIKNYIPNSFVLWLPRDIVSGDFYWFFEHDNKYLLAAADCTGHGVPGAFVSMTCHNILNQIVIDQHEDDPGSILSKVHIAVSNVFNREGTLSKANDGMDISLVCIEPDKKLISFSGAMNSLVQIKGEDITTYKGDRYAIGGRTPLDYKFATTRIHYQENDWFYMFSDGFKDQFGGANGRKYMNANFVKLLQRISAYKPSEQASQLNHELSNWTTGYERTDDVLVIGFTL